MIEEKSTGDMEYHCKEISLIHQLHVGMHVIWMLKDMMMMLENIQYIACSQIALTAGWFVQMNKGISLVIKISLCI